MYIWCYDNDLLCITVGRNSPMYTVTVTSDVTSNDTEMEFNSSIIIIILGVGVAIFGALVVILAVVGIVYCCKRTR